MDNPVIFQATATDLAGNALDTAQITVTNVSTGLPAILYSDLSDTPLSNPFNTNSVGYFNFYCEGQVVNITAEKDGFSQTWKNQFLNTESVIPYMLTLNNTWAGAQSFAGGDYFAGNVLFDGTINIDNFVFNSGGFVEVADGLASSKTMKVNGIKLLNENTLSSANNIVDTDRAVNNVGWWAIAQQNLGSAAFEDITTDEFSKTANEVLKTNDYGLGAGFWKSTEDVLTETATSVSGYSSGATNNPTSTALQLTMTTPVPSQADRGAKMIIGTTDSILYIAVDNGTGYGSYSMVWSENNTTVDVNGFIKEL